VHDARREVSPQCVGAKPVRRRRRTEPLVKVDPVRIHGQPRRVGNVICLPMYHPAAALHQPSLRAVVKEDFLRIPELLEQVDQISDYEPPPEAEQLRLF
jgi:uracil-DNA glycosylase